MKKSLLLCTVALFSILLAGCAERYEYTTVQGIVVDKEYDAPRTYYKTVTDFDGEKVRKKVYDPEEFEIIIRYDTIEKEFEFNDDTFYDRVEIGDAVQLELQTGFDANNEVVSRDIELVY